MLTTVLGLLIAAGVGAYIFLPYLWGWDEGTTEEGPATAGSREELLVQLADLEYDFRAGKLVEADYRKLRRELEARLLELQREPRSEPGADKTAPAPGPSGRAERFSEDMNGERDR